MAQPEISHQAEEGILKSQAALTDEKFPGITATRPRERVFLHTMRCRQRWWITEAAGESRQKARRKLERGLMPNEHVVADAKRAF